MSTLKGFKTKMGHPVFLDGFFVNPNDLLFLNQDFLLFVKQAYRLFKVFFRHLEKPIIFFRGTFIAIMEIPFMLMQ